MSDSAVACIIFIAVMIIIISERIHRAVVAIFGAVLLLALGVMDVEAAAVYVDFNTIGVLVGMMLFMAIVKYSGLFESLAVISAKAAKGDPWRIMIIYMIITALLSSVIDNVTTVLLMGPVTLAITRALRVNPVPFLMTQIMASNIGGTATLIGDPPNIMIGGAAGLSFMDFVIFNGPVVLIVMTVIIIFFKFLYRSEMKNDSLGTKKIMKMDASRMVSDKSLLVKSIIVMLATVTGFVCSSSFNIETSVVALSSAVIMLIIGKQDPEKILAAVEWTTIIFFIGLFIIVGGLVETGTVDRIASVIVNITQGNPMTTMLIILWVSAVLSSTLDNIPFVATMIPLIAAMGESGMDISPLWWALSLGACLGGNGTIIGASANVVVTGMSEKNGYPITYMQYFKIGFPVMLMSVAICTVYMVVMYR